MREHRYSAFSVDWARRRSAAPLDLSRGEFPRLPTTAVVVLVRTREQILRRIVIADTLAPLLDEHESRRRDHRAGLARAFVAGSDLRAVVEDDVHKQSLDVTTDFPATQRLIIGELAAPDLDYIWYCSDDDLRRQGRTGFVVPRVNEAMPEDGESVSALHLIVSRRRGRSLSLTYWPSRTEGVRIGDVLSRALDAYAALPLRGEAPSLRIEERRTRRFSVPEPADRRADLRSTAAKFSEVKYAGEGRNAGSALVTTAARATYLDAFVISRASVLLRGATRGAQPRQSSMLGWLGRYFDCSDRQTAIGGLVQSLKPGQAVHIRAADRILGEEKLTWLAMSRSDSQLKATYLIPVRDIKAPLSLGDVGPRTWFIMKAPSGEAIAVEYWIPTRGNARVRLYDLLAPLEELAHSCNMPFHFQVTDPAAVTVRARWRCEEAVQTVLRVAEVRFPPLQMEEAEQDELLRRLRASPVARDRLSQELSVRRVSAQEILRRRDALRWLSLIVAEMEVEALGSGKDVQPEVFAAALTGFLRACAMESPTASHEDRARVVNLVFEWISGRQIRPYPVRDSIDMGTVSAAMDQRLRALAKEAPWVALLRERLHHGFDWKVEVDEIAFIEALAIGRPHPPPSNRAVAATSKGARREPAATSDLARRAMRDHFDLVSDGQAIHPAGREAWPAAVGRATEILYFRPVEAARDLVLSGAPSAIVDAGSEVAARLAARQAGTLDDLLVLVDRPDQAARMGIVAINTSETARLPFSIATDIENWIGPRAIGTPDVTDYVLGPVFVPAEDSSTVRVGSESLTIASRLRGSINVSQATTEWLTPQLFRGRNRELARLLTPMAMPSGPRIPSAIYGTRRAGKTTLAIHACRTGLDSELLGGWFKLDMSTVHRAGASDEAGYLAQVSAELAQQASAALGIGNLRPQDDPIAVLRELDQEVGSNGRPVGIVLDEFDFLLSRSPQSMLQVLASRLGAMHWENLVVIATVQRFYQRASELKNWSLIQCPPDLSWEAGVTYFCEYLDLERLSGSPIVPVQSPVVTPAIFRERVASRVGYRPYFWGQLRARLEGALVVDRERSAFPDGLLVSQTIDQVVVEDTYLALPIQPTPGLSPSECRRRDLFSEDEKRVLACLVFEDGGSVSLERAAQVGGSEAVQELLERAYLVESADETLTTAIPIFLEALRSRRAEFLPFRIPRTTGVRE